MYVFTKVPSNGFVWSAQGQKSGDNLRRKSDKHAAHLSGTLTSTTAHASGNQILQLKNLLFGEDLQVMAHTNGLEGMQEYAQHLGQTLAVRKGSPNTLRMHLL
jgi:hypothetical protein